MAAMIVAGWDRHRGPQVYSLPIGGSIIPEPWITDGSGSTYIWGFMDSEFKCGAFFPFPLLVADHNDNVPPFGV